MTVYERWYHEKLGVRAVRIQQGRITGVCALPLEDAGRAALDALDYDARPEAIRGIWAASEQFFLFEPWRRGERLSPGTRPHSAAPGAKLSLPRKSERNGRILFAAKTRRERKRER